MSAALVAAVGVRKEDAAGGAPDAPAAAADRDRRTPSRPPAPPEPVREPVSVPSEPVRDDAISSASLDDLNKNSPLKPVFFELDSSDLSAAEPEGRSTRMPRC